MDVVTDSDGNDSDHPNIPPSRRGKALSQTAFYQMWTQRLPYLKVTICLVFHFFIVVEGEKKKNIYL
jgi:hypothetical protein